MPRIQIIDLPLRLNFPLELLPLFFFLNIINCIHPCLNRNFLPPTQTLAMTASAYLSFWDANLFQISSLKKSKNAVKSEGIQDTDWNITYQIIFLGLYSRETYVCWVSEPRYWKKVAGVAYLLLKMEWWLWLSLSLRTGARSRDINMLQAPHSEIALLLPSLSNSTFLSIN